MKAISLALVLVGVLGLVLSTAMFGDIRIAGAIGSLAALLSGVGFWQVARKGPG